MTAKIGVPGWLFVKRDTFTIGEGDELTAVNRVGDDAATWRAIERPRPQERAIGTRVGLAGL
jgi:hypothetical protein